MTWNQSGKYLRSGRSHIDKLLVSKHPHSKKFSQVLIGNYKERVFPVIYGIQFLFR